jgi:hypothetical protein
MSQQDRVPDGWTCPEGKTWCGEIHAEKILGDKAVPVYLGTPPSDKPPFDVVAWLREEAKAIQHQRWNHDAAVLRGAATALESAMTADAACQWCKHSLRDNDHGFDQVDAWVDEHQRLSHSGKCAYCRICRGNAAMKEEGR